MLIYPSIDLYNGNVVGMYRGDYDNMKVYSSNPMDVVNDFVNQGARHLQLTDLDSARTGKLAIAVVQRIKEETHMKLQVGGGIRNMMMIEKYVNAGADRIVIGGAGSRNEAFIKEAVAEYKDRIIVSVDIKDGKLAQMGRIEKGAPNAIDYSLKLQDIGVKTIVCTDVSNAGSMAGVNSEFFAKFADRLDADVIASGGVTSLEDILDLESIGIHGVIVGRAYYDGAIYLKEAIRLAI